MSDITTQYYHLRIQEEVNETLSDMEDAFLIEALQNITMWPRYTEIFKTFRKVEPEEYFAAMREFHEWFANWLAEIIVAREIESKSLEDLDQYIKRSRACLKSA